MRSWELFKDSAVIFSSSEAVSTDSSVRESSESGEDAEGASSGRGASCEPGRPHVLGKVWFLKHRSQQIWESMSAT